MWETSLGWGWTLRKEEGSSVQLSIPKKIEVKTVMKYYCKSTFHSNIFCAKPVHSADSLSKVNFTLKIYLKSFENQNLYTEKNGVSNFECQNLGMPILYCR